MADQQILMTVPKEVIDANVKAAVVNALNKDPQALVRAVVDAALAQKDNRSYGSKTIWEDKVDEMILNVATETFNEWLNEQKPLIASTVRARLENKFSTKGRHGSNPIIDEIVNQLTASLANFRLDVRFFKAE